MSCRGVFFTLYCAIALFAGGYGTFSGRWIPAVGYLLCAVVVVLYWDTLGSEKEEG